MNLPTTVILESWFRTGLVEFQVSDTPTAVLEPMRTVARLAALAGIADPSVSPSAARPAMIAFFRREIVLVDFIFPPWS